MIAKFQNTLSFNGVVQWMGQYGGNYHLIQVKTGKLFTPQDFAENAMSLDFIQGEQRAGRMTGSAVRDNEKIEGEKQEYNQITFELGTDDKELAETLAKVIVQELANPDYTYPKNQGKQTEKTQFKTIEGEREVFYKLDLDTDGTYHLHTMAHFRAIKNGVVSSPDVLSYAKAFEQATNQITNKLASLGLPTLSSVSNTMSRNNSKASVATKAAVQQHINGQQDIETSLAKLATRSIEEIPLTALDDALINEQSEAEKLYEAYKRKLDQIEKIKQAKSVHEQLAFVNSQFEKAKATIDGQNQALKEATQRLQELTNETSALHAQAFSNNETIKELTGKIEGLENDYSNQAEELAEALASTKAEATKAAQFEAQAESLAQALKEATEGRLNAEQRATLAEAQAQAERAEKREALAVSEKLAETIKTREVQITAANKETAEQEKRAEAAEQRAEQAERVIQAMNSRLEKIAVMVVKIAETAEKKLEPVKAKLTKTGQALVSLVQKQTAELREAFAQAPAVPAMLASGEATDPEEALRKATQRAREAREKREREEAQKNTPSGRKPT